MVIDRILILVVLVAAVLLLTRIPVMLRARKVKGRTLEHLGQVLPAGVDPSARLLLYFWSPSCGICRSTTPVINEMQQQRNDVLSVNAAERLELAREAGIMGTPAFVVVERGNIEQLVMGARNRRQLEAMLAQN